MSLSIGDAKEILLRFKIEILIKQIDNSKKIP